MNKTVLITGSRKGIGRYLTERYLSDGYNVIGCSRNATDLKHINYTHYCLDVSDESAIKKMLKNNKIDILINNAGIASMNHFLLTTKQKAIEIMNINFIGTFLMCREVGKLMIIQKSGKIINFSSLGVKMNIPGESVYLASKAAIETLTKILAKELPKGVTINCIAPGVVDTDLSRHARKAIPKTTFDQIYTAINYFIDTDETGEIFYI